MYNEIIKNRYIQEKESTTNMPKGYLERQFNKSEFFEEKLNKDICNFTAYEIMDFYKTINISSLESLVVLNSHLSLYTQWCMCQNLIPDCQNHFEEIDSDILIECINTTTLEKSIITRETLNVWLTNLDNPGDAFVMLCLFEGIKGKEFCEIANMKMSDFSGNTVKLCTGREMIVPDKLIELAEITDKTMEYHAVSKTNKKIYPLVDEGYILKRYSNSQEDASDYQRGRRIYQKLLRNFTDMKIASYMKPNSLIESGKIDYINRRSQALKMSAKEFLDSEYVKEVKDKYDYDMKRLKVSFCRKYGEYLI